MMAPVGMACLWVKVIQRVLRMGVVHVCDNIGMEDGQCHCGWEDWKREILAANPE